MISMITPELRAAPTDCSEVNSRCFQMLAESLISDYNVTYLLMDRVSRSQGCPQICYEAENVLKVLVHLTPSLICQDYKRALCPVMECIPCLYLSTFLANGAR